MKHGWRSSRTTSSSRPTSSAPRAARCSATCTSAGWTTSSRAWRPRSSTPACPRTASSTSTRSCSPSSTTGSAASKKIEQLIKNGQSLLVQVVKDPMGTKGARVTMDVSLAGRFLVYSPDGKGYGVSKRLPDGERDRLRDLVKTLTPKGGGGLIVRTAARGAQREELERDLDLLEKQWAYDQRRRQEEDRQGAGADPRGGRPRARDGARRPARRGRRGDHRRPGHVRRIRAFVETHSPEFLPRIKLHEAQTPLLRRYQVEDAIRSTMHRRVDLPSGGYLLFDYAEAFTIIDVNTGRFVGKSRLEDTILANNLEAAREVVRQLRLRDIGGMIVIDFIDMSPQKNRDAVIGCLQEELKKDRSKVYLTSISPLGLVEMTRQNVTDGVREIMTATCPVCSGEGRVLSKETIAIENLRTLRRHASLSNQEAFLVELDPEIAALMVGPGGSRLAELERSTGKHFSLVGVDGVPIERCSVTREGTAADILGRVDPGRRRAGARAGDRRAAHVPGRRRGRLPRRRLPHRRRRLRPVPGRAPHRAHRPRRPGRGDRDAAHREAGDRAGDARADRPAHRHPRAGAPPRRARRPRGPQPPAPAAPAPGQEGRRRQRRRGRDRRRRPQQAARRGDGRWWRCGRRRRDALVAQPAAAPSRQRLRHRGRRQRRRRGTVDVELEDLDIDLDAVVAESGAEDDSDGIDDTAASEDGAPTGPAQAAPRTPWRQAASRSPALPSAARAARPEAIEAEPAVAVAEPEPPAEEAAAPAAPAPTTASPRSRAGGGRRPRSPPPPRRPSAEPAAPAEAEPAAAPKPRRARRTKAEIAAAAEAAAAEPEPAPAAVTEVAPATDPSPRRSRSAGVASSSA